MRFGLLASLLLCGCAAPQFPAPDASWRSYSGQLQYANAGRSVIGEFTASRRGDDFHLEFTKGGAVPLMHVALHDGAARAEGPLARGRWSGPAGKAPMPLRGWVTEVPRAFMGLEPLLKAARAGDERGAAQRLQVRGAQAGEKFVFIFER